MEIFFLAVIFLFSVGNPFHPFLELTRPRKKAKMTKFRSIGLKSFTTVAGDSLHSSDPSVDRAIWYEQGVPKEPCAVHVMELLLENILVQRVSLRGYLPFKLGFVNGALALKGFQTVRLSLARRTLLDILTALLLRPGRSAPFL